ncbi:MAG: hypothetical protein ABJ327_19935 [Litoreibacter sp.]
MQVAKEDGRITKKGGEYLRITFGRRHDVSTASLRSLFGIAKLLIINK